MIIVLRAGTVNTDPQNEYMRFLGEIRIEKYFAAVSVALGHPLTGACSGLHPLETCWYFEKCAECLVTLRHPPDFHSPGGVCSYY